MRTTLTMPGMPRDRALIDADERGADAGGRMTRPCNMPGSLKSCMNVKRPVTLSGMSRRGTGLPDQLVSRSGDFNGASWSSSSAKRRAADRAHRTQALAGRLPDDRRRRESTSVDASRSSFAAALCSNARRAVAAARRSCAPPFWIDRLPDVATLVRREHGVALNERDVAERHVELFGDDLRERGAHARAEIDLARVDGDLAVRADARGSYRPDPVRRALRWRHGLCRRQTAAKSESSRSERRTL